MRFAVLAILAGLLLVVPGSIQAHHSFTSFWYVDRTVEIEGIVKSLRVVNPHAELIVEVTEANGQNFDWNVTSRGTGSALVKAGWTKNTLAVGLKVKVEGNPSRKEGARALAAGKVTKPDGSEVWLGGGGGVPQG